MGFRGYIENAANSAIVIFAFGTALGGCALAVDHFIVNDPHFLAFAESLFFGSLLMLALALVVMFFTRRNILIAWICILPIGILIVAVAYWLDYFYVTRGQTTLNFFQWFVAGNASFEAIKSLLIVAGGWLFVHELLKGADRYRYRHRHGK